MKEKTKVYIPWHLIIIFIFLLISIGITGYYFFQTQKEDIKKEKQNELAVIADLKIEQIVNWRKERMGDASIILKSPFIDKHVQQFFKNPHSPALKNGISEWMKVFQESYQYEAMILIDSKGIARLAVPDEKGDIGPDAKSLAEEALRTKKIIFSDIYHSKIVDAIRLSLVIPILNPQGSETTPIGVFLLRIDPSEFLFPLIQSWPTPSQTGETLLVRREGNEVIYLNELRHKKGTAFTLMVPLSKKKLPAAMAVQGGKGVVEGIDYRSLPVLAALHAIPDSPWFLIAKVDQEEIYETIHRRAWVIGIITSILILASGLGICLIWRHQRSRFYRREYELELQQEELLRRYEYLSRYANDIILLLNQDFKIIEANERGVEAYGYTHDA